MQTVTSIDPPDRQWRRLSTLRPQFDEVEHGRYVSRIKEALDDKSPNAPRNIALTGPYGSGKSSILNEIEKRYGDASVVGISLSTVIPRPLSGAAASQEQSNEIQKEIVKQLLYREKPNKLGSLRFRRVEPFSPRRALAIAAISTMAILSLSFLTGLSVRMEQLAGTFVLGLGLLWIIAFVAVGGTVYSIQYAFHNRFRITGISAGPATISSGKESDDTGLSFFDRYLDEIVYFFAATTCSIAIFEDLDRFESIEIFEELRELNFILNSSKQIGRPIRFIFAMRDSLFDEIGWRRSKETGQGEPKVDAAAARAKFFDLVVPVVPFATGRTSLDLWTREMTKSGISIDVLAIAARHIHDMRMIRSVRNEFEVFRGELERNTVADLRLRPDVLFALMLYKATHLKEFEAIKDGDSPLDKAEALRRNVIAHNVTLLDQQAKALRSGSLAQDTLDRRAQDLGKRLEESLELAQRLGIRSSAWSFEVNGRTFELADISQTEFWKSLSDHGNNMHVILSGNQIPVSVSDLGRLVGRDISDLSWELDTSEIDVLLTQNERRRRTLLRSEWSDLLKLDWLEVGQEARSLEIELARAVNSDLAVELLEASFIDRNFSLYVSRFYGEVVSARAMNFVLHVVQPGLTAVSESLTKPYDVQGVLREAGSGFLATRSAFNIDIVDALADDEKLAPTLKRLAVGDEPAVQFLDAYMLRGMERQTVVNRLAAHFSGILPFILEIGRRDEPLAVSLLDSALPGLSTSVNYESHPDFAAFVRKHEGSLTSLTLEHEPEAQKAIVAMLDKGNVRLADLSHLGGLREPVAEIGLFEVTSVNLIQALGAEENWTLDKIAVTRPLLFRHLVRNAQAYLAALPDALPTLNEPTQFKETLRSLDPIASSEGFDAIIDRASPSLLLTTLDGVPKRRWATLVHHGRVQDSLTTWEQYFAEHGLDDSLMNRVSTIVAVSDASTASEQQRLDLALAVLSESRIAPMKRARFAASLKLPDSIPIGKIRRQNSPLFGYLAARNVVDDSAATFNELKSHGWHARKAYIRYAKGFSSYASSALYTRNELLAVFREPTIPNLVKSAILSDLSGLGKQLVPPVANEVLRWIVRSRPKISVPHIQALAAAGAEGRLLARLFLIYTFDDASLLAVLGSARNPWRKLTIAGRRPALPHEPEVIALIERLQKMGRVRSFRTLSSDTIRATVGW